MNLSGRPHLPFSLVLAGGGARGFAHVGVLQALAKDGIVPSALVGEVARVENGLQAIMRAMEICHLRHAALRMRQADLVIRPAFPRAIDVLDFASRHMCVAVGVEAAVRARVAIHDLLEVDPRARTDRRS